MRTRSPLCVLGLLALLLAGCGAPAATPNGPAGNEDPPSRIVVEPEAGLFVAENRGIVRGILYDDASLALKGGHVSLLGTDFFATTAIDGSFRFDNVTVGAHRLHAVAEGFLENETSIDVTRGNITDVDVFLLPDESRGGGYRPHVHDYWGSSEEYTLIDNDYDFSRVPATSLVLNDTRNQDSALMIRPPLGTPDHPSVILPGTREIRIKLAWDGSDSTFVRLGVQYWPSNAPNLPAYEPFTLPPQPSGQAWTLTIPPTWTDSGHQLNTLWYFFLCPCNDARAPSTFQPGAFLGPIHVTMVLVKGNVALEPAHPDFWKDKEMLVLRPRGEYRTIQYTNVNQRGLGNCLTIGPGLLVPPGTTRLRVDMAWRYATSNGSAVDRPWVLTWRSGDQDRFGTTFAQLKRSAPAYEGDHYIVYDLALKPSEADPFYLRNSNWCFLPSEKGRENDDRAMDIGRGISVDMGVTVWRSTGTPGGAG